MLFLAALRIKRYSNRWSSLSHRTQRLGRSARRAWAGRRRVWGCCATASWPASQTAPTPPSPATSAWTTWPPSSVGLLRPHFSTFLTFLPPFKWGLLRILYCFYHWESSRLQKVSILKKIAQKRLFDLDLLGEKDSQEQVFMCSDSAKVTTWIFFVQPAHGYSLNVLPFGLVLMGLVCWIRLICGIFLNHWNTF